MGADRAELPESLPLSGARRINEACERFEADWRAGRRPRIEDHLGAAMEPERSAMLVELLALERELRGESGEDPTASEYRERFPEHAAVIDALFEASASSIGGGASPDPDPDP